VDESAVGPPRWKRAAAVQRQRHVLRARDIRRCERTGGNRRLDQCDRRHAPAPTEAAAMPFEADETLGHRSVAPRDHWRFSNWRHAARWERPLDDGIPQHRITNNT